MRAAMISLDDPVAADAAEAAIADAAARTLRPLADAEHNVRLAFHEGKATSITAPIPARALRILLRVLDSMAAREPVSIVHHEVELTTQQAADLLNVSRPYLIKLLEEDKISFRLVGRHRRIRYGDLLAFEKKSMADRRKALAEMTAEAQAMDLPD